MGNTNNRDRIVSRDRLYLAVAGLLGLLIICDAAFLSSSWTRLLWGIFGYTALFLTAKLAGLSRDDIGLSKGNINSGVRYAVPIIAIIGTGLLLVFLIDKEAFRDPRYHHGLAAALGSSLIILPLKTILFEEIAFRGVMAALFLKLSDSRRQATVWSSLAFGLWHISTIGGVANYKLVGGLVVPRPIVYIAVLLVTTLAGAVFCELRWRSRSLAAPILVHWFINGAATVVAALAWSY